LIPVGGVAHTPLRFTATATAPAATGKLIAGAAVSPFAGHGPLDGCGPNGGGTIVVFRGVSPLLQAATPGTEPGAPLIAVNCEELYGRSVPAKKSVRQLIRSRPAPDPKDAMMPCVL
jgi:hypothetical protein